MGFCPAAGPRIPLRGESIPPGVPEPDVNRDLIGQLLWNYFTQNPIGEAVGECDCEIAPDEVRRPDLSVFFNDHIRQIDPEKIPAPLAPNIAIEVVSRSESAVELRREIRDYLRAAAKRSVS